MREHYYCVLKKRENNTIISASSYLDDVCLFLMRIHNNSISHIERAKMNKMDSFFFFGGFVCFFRVLVVCLRVFSSAQQQWLKTCFFRVKGRKRFLFSAGIRWYQWSIRIQKKNITSFRESVNSKMGNLYSSRFWKLHTHIRFLFRRFNIMKMIIIMQKINVTCFFLFFNVQCFCSVF